MANITPYLNKIKSAIYGEEVRGSIHDAIQAINNVVDSSDQAHLMNSIAPTYDTVNISTKYNVGDFVFRADGSGRLYMCKVATTGGIDFVGANWVEIPIATILGNYVEVNQFRFDSNTSETIISGKSCDELTTSNVWYVWCRSGTPVVIDFPINGPGWIRVTATGARIVQQVYPSDPLKFPYRLYRTRDGRDNAGNSSSSGAAWSSWYKIPYYSENSNPTEDFNNLKVGLLSGEYTDANAMNGGLFNLVEGSIDADRGVYTTSSIRCRTTMFHCDGALRIEFNNPNYLLRVWGYRTYDNGNSGTKAYAKNQTIDNLIVMPTSTTRYVIVGFARTDGAVLTTDVTDSSSDYYIIQHALKVYNMTNSSRIEVSGTRLILN